MEKNKTFFLGGIAVFALVCGVFAFLLWNRSQKDIILENMTQRQEEQKGIGAEPQAKEEPEAPATMQTNTGDSVIDAEITKLNDDLKKLTTDELELNDL